MLTLSKGNRVNLNVFLVPYIIENEGQILKIPPISPPLDPDPDLSGSGQTLPPHLLNIMMPLSSSWMMITPPPRVSHHRRTKGSPLALRTTAQRKAPVHRISLMPLTLRTLPTALSLHLFPRRPCLAFMQIWNSRPSRWLSQCPRSRSLLLPRRRLRDRPRREP